MEQGGTRASNSEPPQRKVPTKKGPTPLHRSIGGRFGRRQLMFQACPRDVEDTPLALLVSHRRQVLLRYCRGVHALVLGTLVT